MYPVIKVANTTGGSTSKFTITASNERDYIAIGNSLDRNHTDGEKLNLQVAYGVLASGTRTQTATLMVGAQLAKMIADKSSAVFGVASAIILGTMSAVTLF